MSESRKIAVLGAGSWGTTLANLLCENGHDVTLWARSEEQAFAIRSTRKNERYLPGVTLDNGLSIDSDLAVATTGANLLVFAVPTHAVRDLASSLVKEGLIGTEAIVVNTAKGLEEHTTLRMSQVLLDELPVGDERILSLVGPSHAEEVSRRIPTSVVIAGVDVAICKSIQAVFMNRYFRVYTNTDHIGVEIGVALKNCIAIASGIVDGLDYGDNTKAALITRGRSEIARLGVALGATENTFSGLAGLGDLVVTCLSRHSRNRHVGEAIGRGQTLEMILGEMVMVAEGVRTTRVAVELGKNSGVELPIIETVHQVLFEGLDARSAIDQLMTRPPREEMSG